MGKKILLADDSITIQKVIELTFSDEDFEVVTVGNGRLAIERLPEARPDLVLCDIIMPEKDGYEVCDFIKKHPTLSKTPVLLLTGAFEPFDQERAARVGCDGFLAKPFEPQTLIAKVKDLLAQAGSKSAASAPAAAPAPAPASYAPAATQAAPAWSSPAPAAPAPSAPTPAPVSFSPPPPAPVAPPPAPEAAPDDDFGSGEAFGAGAVGTSAFGGGADIGTLKSPAFRVEEKDRFAAPPSLDELYDDDPYGGANDLMPLSDDEADSVSPPAAMPESDEPAPWAQPTVEVPLEMRAQAGVESQMASDGFEEVFEDEASVPPPAPREVPAAPAAAPAPPAPSTVDRGFSFGRQEDVPAPPSTPSVSSPAGPSTIKAGFGWGRDAEVPAAPAAAAAPAPAPTPARDIPDSSFRDVAPAEEEEQTSISRSVAGEVNVPVDMVEKIAQRVVAQISEKVIREIAWEVIPDLAEALIKREIDRLKAELQQT